jgi:hypothetical protein
LIGWRCIATAAVDTRTEVVHHDMCTVASQAQRMFATDAATSTRDYHHSTFTQLGHDRDSFPTLSSDV